ncbi:MAG: insulinase family protein, partial [Spirochaetaceae bacterium]|nr:insulinase family protein [Spirochaetaceae bacterium]
MKKNFFRKIFFVLAAALVFSMLNCTSLSSKAGMSKLNDPIPFMEGVRTGTLKNGLTYYIYENKKPQDRAFLTLAVNAGSVLETEEERGLAHFVEHMAFNGTKRFPESALVEYLRSLGMRFGADLNAYTSFDETVYRLEVPVTSDQDGVRRIPAEAVEIISDWTNAIKFDVKDVDDERNVIMEEYRLRLGASERMWRFLQPRLFEGSKYANREPIGLPGIIQNAPAKTLTGFYKKWYVPQNMAVIFVGDFDGEALEKSLNEYFQETAPGADFSRPFYVLPDPVKGKKETAFFIDSEQSGTSIDLLYKHPFQEPENNVERYKTELTDMLIESIMEERFKDETLKADSPFIEGDASLVHLVRGALHYDFSAFIKTDRSKDGLELLLRMKENAQRFGFSNSEISRAKESLISALKNSVTEKKPSDYFVSLFKDNFLEDQYVSSAIWDLETAQKLLPSIDKKVLQNRFNYYFSYDDVFVLLCAPENGSESLPDDDFINNA